MKIAGKEINLTTQVFIAMILGAAFGIIVGKPMTQVGFIGKIWLNCITLAIIPMVLVLIIIFNRSSNRYLRMSSIVIGLVIGYITAWALGMVDFSAVQSYGGFNIPIPFRYGISFDIS